MARFPCRGLLFLLSGGGGGRSRLLSMARSGEPHPSAAYTPTSYWIYAAEASAYLYPIGTTVSCSRHRALAGAAAASYRSRASASSSPYSAPAAGWRLLPLAAAAALGGCIGGGIVAIATAGGHGREVVKPVDIYGMEDLYEVACTAPVKVGYVPPPFVSELVMESPKGLRTPSTMGAVLTNISYKLPRHKLLFKNLWYKNVERLSEGKALEVVNSIWVSMQELSKQARAKILHYLKMAWYWSLNEIREDMKAKVKKAIYSQIFAAITVKLGLEVFFSGETVQFRKKVSENLLDHESRITELEQSGVKIVAVEVPEGGNPKVEAVEAPGGGKAKVEAVEAPGGGKAKVETVEAPGGGKAKVEAPGGGKAAVEAPGGGKAAVEAPGGGKAAVEAPAGGKPKVEAVEAPGGGKPKVEGEAQ